MNTKHRKQAYKILIVSVMVVLVAAPVIPFNLISSLMVSAATQTQTYVFSFDTSLYNFQLQNGVIIDFTVPVIYFDNYSYINSNEIRFWHLSTGEDFSPNIGWQTSNDLTIISLDNNSKYNRAKFNVTGLSGDSYLVKVWCGNQGQPAKVFLDNVLLSGNHTFDTNNDTLSIWSTLHSTPHTWEIYWSLPSQIFAPIQLDPGLPNPSKIQNKSGTYILQNNYLKVKIVQNAGNNTVAKILDKNAFKLNNNTDVSLQYAIKWTIDYRPASTWIAEDIASSRFYRMVQNSTGAYLFENCTTSVSGSIITVCYKILTGSDRLKYDLTLTPKVAAAYRIVYNMKTNATLLSSYVDQNLTSSAQIFEYGAQKLSFDYSDVPVAYKTAYNYVNGKFVFRITLPSLSVGQKVEIDPSTIALDVSGKYDTHTTATPTITITTTKNYELLMLDTNSYHSYVTSVTDSIGTLTWIKRATANKPQITNTWNINCTEWYATWSSHGAITVTVTLNATGDTNQADAGVLYAVQNYDNSTNGIFDGATAIGTQIAGNTGGPNLLTFYNFNPNDMLCQFMSNTVTLPSPWTLILSTSGYGSFASYYQVVSSTATYGNGASAYSQMIFIDGIRQYGSPSYTTTSTTTSTETSTSTVTSTSTSTTTLSTFYTAITMTQKNYTFTVTIPTYTLTATVPTYTLTYTNPSYTLTYTQKNYTETDTHTTVTLTYVQPTNVLTYTQHNYTLTATNPTFTLTYTQPTNTLTYTNPTFTLTDLDNNYTFTISVTQPIYTLTATNPTFTLTIPMQTVNVINQTYTTTMPTWTTTTLSITNPTWTTTSTTLTIPIYTVSIINGTWTTTIPTYTTTALTITNLSANMTFTGANMTINSPSPLEAISGNNVFLILAFLGGILIVIAFLVQNAGPMFIGGTLIMIDGLFLTHYSYTDTAGHLILPTTDLINVGFFVFAIGLLFMLIAIVLYVANSLKK